MSPRRIDTSTQNRTVTEPATVEACGRDLGNAAEQAARADAATGQLEAAKFHAKESAESRGRRRTA